MVMAMLMVGMGVWAMTAAQKQQKSLYGLRADTITL
jgi:hypothetical protein